MAVAGTLHMRPEDKNKPGSSTYQPMQEAYNAFVFVITSLAMYSWGFWFILLGISLLVLATDGIGPAVLVMGGGTVVVVFAHWLWSLISAPMLNQAILKLYRSGHKITEIPDSNIARKVLKVIMRRQRLHARMFQTKGVEFGEVMRAVFPDQDTDDFQS
jgi:hypothetical protein